MPFTHIDSEDISVHGGSGVQSLSSHRQMFSETWGWVFAGPTWCEAGSGVELHLICRHAPEPSTSCAVHMSGNCHRCTVAEATQLISWNSSRRQGTLTVSCSESRNAGADSAAQCHPWPPPWRPKPSALPETSWPPQSVACLSRPFQLR